MLVIFFPIANILMFLPKNRYDPIVKWMTRILLNLIGIRVEVEFLENLDRNGSYLFLSNHVNILDPFLLYGYIPTSLRRAYRRRELNISDGFYFTEFDC